MIVDVESTLVDPVWVVEAERHGDQSPPEGRQQVHALGHQFANQRGIQWSARRGDRFIKPQSTYVALRVGVFRCQEQCIEGGQLSHCLVVSTYPAVAQRM